MITLTVISLNGAPTAGAPSASFDELGGTIGRADNNQMVLPDPDRAISRVHAQVVYRAGAYALVDRGSNPVLVNGQPVGSGREVQIGDGDRVQIGGFVLQVRRQAAARGGAPATDDPFADLLGPAASARAPAGAPGGAGLFDPLAAFDAGAPARPGAPPAPTAPALNAAPAARGIPEDWDPFAPDPVGQRAPERDFAQSLGRPGGAGRLGLDGGAAAPAALVPDLPGGGGSDDSLDALFGLKPGAGGDPLANSRLDAPMSAPNMAASQDPLRSLDSAPLASAQTVQDDLSDLRRPYAPPPAFDRAAPAAAAAASPSPSLSPLPPAPQEPPMSPAAFAPAAPSFQPPVPPAPASAPAIPAGAVLSWDAPEGEGRTVIRPTARSAASYAGPARDAASDGAGPAAPAFPSPSTQSAAPAAAAPGTPPVPPPPAPSTATAATPVAPANSMTSATGVAGAPGATDEVAALLAAFREGLGVPELKLDRLTPELMRLVGELLHESARGTVDLLVARSALKREVRAEATMIVAQKNNPLKFSPSAEVALQHLLSPTMRGFMAPAPAMRDAYDDLRAHQFGFIAGMRAALAGVLERFRPSELEGRLNQPTGLRALLPGSRKAAMWEVFTEHYAQIGAEAEEDFHSLFGKAFLKAYEEHIAQLGREPV